jgi:hypothetical protein
MTLFFVTFVIMCVIAIALFVLGKHNARISEKKEKEARAILERVWLQFIDYIKTPGAAEKFVIEDWNSIPDVENVRKAARMKSISPDQLQKFVDSEVSNSFSNRDATSPGRLINAADRLASLSGQGFNQTARAVARWLARYYPVPLTSWYERVEREGSRKTEDWWNGSVISTVGWGAPLDLVREELLKQGISPPE